MELFENRRVKCLDVIEVSMDQFTRQNIRFFVELRGETTIRVTRMDAINREMRKHFLSDQFFQNMTRSCSAALAESLRGWKGVLKSKKFSAAATVEFSAYFKTAKNWLDQRKTKMLCDVLWVPLFAVIEQVLYFITNQENPHRSFYGIILLKVSNLFFNRYDVNRICF